MKSKTKCQAMLNGWLVREKARNMKKVFMLLQSRIRTKRKQTSFPANEKS